VRRMKKVAELELAELLRRMSVAARLIDWRCPSERALRRHDLLAGESAGALARFERAAEALSRLLAKKPIPRMA
jgi:hypothetical protein